MGSGTAIQERLFVQPEQALKIPPADILNQNPEETCTDTEKLRTLSCHVYF